MLRMRTLMVPLIAVSCVGGVRFVSAASAAAKKPTRHVAPFGVGVRRAPRHIAARSSAAPATQPSIITTTTTTTEWVSNSVPIGTNKSCASPGYSTISSALAAAPPSGAVIKVCSGTYPEQLAITKSVTLAAVGAVTVLGPSSRRTT